MKLRASEFEPGDVIVHRTGHEFEVRKVEPELHGYLVTTTDLVFEFAETFFHNDKHHEIRREEVKG